MKFTSETVSDTQLPKGASDKIFFDDDLPGFGLRIRQGGSRTFIFRYQIGDLQRRMNLGVANERTLSQARKTAEKLQARVKLGEDPASTKAEAKATAAHTFKAVADEYLQDQKPKWRPRTYPDVERHLLTHAKGLHQLQLGKITRADIAKVHASVPGEGVTANRVRVSLSGLFTWAIQRGRVDANPVTDSPRHEEVVRDRVLVPADLRVIWNNLEDNDYAAIIKLLALTGQRPGEIAGLRWSQIYEDSIILEGGDETGGTKNYRDHVIPLSEAAKAIINQQPKREGRDYIFGRGEKPFSGWSNCKERLNARIKAATGKALKDWRPHDFRRTFASLASGGLEEKDLEKLKGRDKELASGLGIAPHIIEAVTNHVSAYKPGVSATYNKSTYALEKRRALEQWAVRLLDIVEDRPAVVVPIKRA